MESKVINEDRFPDHMEIDLGGTGARGKIYFNSSNEKEAKDRMEAYFRIAEYKEELLNKFKTKSSEDEK